MLAYKLYPLLDELNKQENTLLDMWNSLPAYYNINDPLELKKYENIAGQIRHIEKCKKLLMHQV